MKLFRILCITGIFVMTFSFLVTARAYFGGLFAASATASQQIVQENASSPDISGAWHLFWTARNGTEHQGTMQIKQDGKKFSGTIKGGGHGTIRLKGTLDGNLKNQFVPNPINRYSVSNRSGLLPNADGSVDIYIQHAAPSTHESNWLPAPSGDYILRLRVYLPGEAILDGQYKVPPVLQTQ